MADSVQKTVIEVFCCTCNFLLFSIEQSPEDSPVLKVCNEKDPNCARPRLRYRIKQVAAETISEPSQYRDADCSVTHEEWDKMTTEQKAPILKKYRFLFYKEDKTPVPECVEAVNKYIESRKFAQTVPVTTAKGCYLDKRCKEPVKKCATCAKRVAYDAALQAKSRRREQDLLIRRAQLRGETLQPKADKPPVVEVTPEVEVAAKPVAPLPMVPTSVVEPQPEARKYVSLRQWLELRNQELSTMGKKHSKKQKAAKPKKVKAKKQKTVKKLAKKGKKHKKRHTEEEE